MVAWVDLLTNAEELSHDFVADGLLFGEGPRYNPGDGHLYLSDMIGKKVYRIDGASGAKELVLEVPEQPNGLAFHPDGSLVYTSMFDGKLFRFDLATRKSTLWADLSPLMTGYCGDIVIDGQGRAYVDDVGARVLHGESQAPGRLLIVEPDGTLKLGPENLGFPNGITIDSTGKKLYLSETFAHRLTTFDISNDGQLSNKQSSWDLAALDDPTAINGIDGMCMDAEDALWFSMLDHHAFVRRNKEGHITNYIKVDGHATACTLGGKDGNTLFLITNKWDSSKGNIFEAMANKQTTCTVSKTTVKIGRGKALP